MQINIDIISTILRLTSTVHYLFLFFLICFWANKRSIFHNFFLCCPSQRSAIGQVPSQVATHQEMGNQLWAGETPDSNPGLQDKSLAHYHWATTSLYTTCRSSSIAQFCRRTTHFFIEESRIFLHLGSVSPSYGNYRSMAHYTYDPEASGNPLPAVRTDP